MDWKSLPAFLAVARNGSLRAAAEQLGGTLATLRRQIEAREAQLGTQLFRRAADSLGGFHNCAEARAGLHAIGKGMCRGRAPTSRNAAKAKVQRSLSSDFSTKEDSGPSK
ncbi:LysR family transcriptional regulator [uncultured Roseovarius sp.]|uniref:LysR family transcriptional regulator n=1 Tax=uncultured Roseovarius sp. TaxID=293344 RepID=UPI002604889D|nr:LysR family transcriptional regulator [uncultured Roseovarius sp.]